MLSKTNLYPTIIGVFSEMRTLKFNPRPTVYAFCCRQSSDLTSREAEVHFNRVKRSRLLIVIGRFRSSLFVSVCHGSLAVAIIMIDGSEKRNRWLDFEFQSSHFTENCNKGMYSTWVKCRTFRLIICLVMAMAKVPIPLLIIGSLTKQIYCCLGQAEKYPEE